MLALEKLGIAAVAIGLLTTAATQAQAAWLPKRGDQTVGTQQSPQPPYAAQYNCVQVRSGSWIDAILFSYDLMYDTQFYGGSGGSLRNKVCCNGTDKVVGYFSSFWQAWLGGPTTMFGINLRCVTASGSEYTTKLSGPGGGQMYYDRCPSGQVIRQFNVWSNPYVYALQGYCG